MAKDERLTNLVIGLLTTRQFIGIGTIRRSFSGYADAPSQEAFQRMFERDKRELRDIGIPIITGTASVWSDEPGYRIDPSSYELPPITLTRDESHAVAVAASLWRDERMAGLAVNALRKLRAAGIEVDDSGISTMVGTAGSAGAPEPALERLVAAASSGQAVRFTHLMAGRGTTAVRTVEPWAVVSSHGNWYLVGFDRDRQAQRTFRLSRILGDVEVFGPVGAVSIPEGVDTRALVEAAAAEPVAPGHVELWLEEDRAHDLRRLAEPLRPASLRGRPGEVVRIPVGNRENTLRLIAGHGEHAVVLGPDDVRADVIALLRGAVAAHPQNAPAPHPADAEEPAR